MSPSSSTRLLLSLAFICVSATAAFAQIDSRVNTGNSSSAGRALDASPQSGASGYNLVRPQLTNPGAASNAIIMGNVTGLAGFKGYSPIVSPNQFRDSLPSSSLSGFQARSVGLDDVRNDRTRVPTYYYGREETFSDIGFIREGLNAPGSSMLQSSYVQPISPAARPISTELASKIPDQGDQRVNMASTPVTPGDGRSVTNLANDPFLKPAATRNPFESAMSSSIFGSPPPSQRSRVADSSTLRFSIPGQDTQFASTDPKQVSALEGLNSVDTSRVNRAVVADEKPQVRPIGSADAPLPADSEDPSLQPNKLPPSGAPVQPAARDLPVAPAPQLGDDRFMDLYSAVSQAQEAGVRKFGFEVPGEGDSQIQLDRPTAADAAEATADALRRSTAAISEMSAAAKWARDVIDDPIKSFVGKYQNKLNRYLAEGEAALHAGEYYTAARMFDLAHTVDPVNPLPLLARGHALVAAGDYTSGVRSLISGIERFPQIASFQLDLPALVGQADVFDRRRSELSERLANTDNAELRFLLGYIELYSNLADAGMKDLRQAAKLAPEGSIISIFPDIVTGQRELPPIKK